MSSPKLLAVVAARLYSSMRSLDEAMRRLPTRFQSIAWPVSSSKSVIEGDRESEHARDIA